MVYETKKTQTITILRVFGRPKFSRPFFSRLKVTNFNGKNWALGPTKLRYSPTHYTNPKPIKYIIIRNPASLYF